MALKEILMKKFILCKTGEKITTIVNIVLLL